MDFPITAMTTATSTTTTASRFGAVEHRALDCDDVAALVDDLIRERSVLLAPLLERYSDWISETQGNAMRSENEYTRDLLTLGVLWRCYGARAIAVPAPFAWMMSGLLRLRQWKLAWQPAVDRVRSWLAEPLLGPRFGDVDVTGIPSRCALAALLRWMEATGDYSDEVARLRPLCAFLASRDKLEREWYLAQLSAFSARFGFMAERRFRGNTVPALRTDVDEQQQRMEAALHVTRKRIEYQLSVVGDELRRRPGCEGDASGDPALVSC
jgi:hypothetical protein